MSSSSRSTNHHECSALVMCSFCRPVPSAEHIAGRGRHGARRFFLLYTPPLAFVRAPFPAVRAAEGPPDSIVSDQSGSEDRRPPGAPGRWFESWLASTATRGFTVMTDEDTVVGNTAYGLGSPHATAESKEPSPTPQEGQPLMVHDRDQDGGRRILRDMFSSNRPVRRGP